MSSREGVTGPHYIPDRRIAVIGMGTVSSIGLDTPSFWHNLITGESGVRDITESHLGPYSRVMQTKIGAPVVEFALLDNPRFQGRHQDIYQVQGDGERWINVAKEEKNFHLSHKYGLDAAYQGMGDGEYGADLLLPGSIFIDPDQIAHDQVGVNFATGLAGGDVLIETQAKLDAELRRELGDEVVDAYAEYIRVHNRALGIELSEEEVRSLSSGQVRTFHMQQALTGRPAEVITMISKARAFERMALAECAASTEAIADAADQIRMGRAKVVVAGGTEAVMLPPEILAFERHKGAVSSSDEYDKNPNPMDKNRTGFVFGEGAGSQVLADWDWAVAHGKKIYAELIGWGSSADGYDPVEPHPEGINLSFTRALRMAGLEDRDISNAVVNLHTPGTPADVIEAAVYTSRLRPEQTVGFHSIKGSTGHPLGGAGVIESNTTVLSLHHGVIPVSRNMRDPEDIVANYPTAMGESIEGVDAELGIKNSAGFGGHNATLIYRRHNA